ncbi:polysaccharide biosynthesis tyrosine autokinase [Arthrobacter sp. zg-Y820]|uniref:polysaccharide biosynthesis tyrosine autokinase n=1 Tax=unclassified Arthrobacter TaxID=235627 RepID=UPI001E4F1001|nr:MULTISPECIES: polysaccharide biosynthesis tyrosine autokinase [unclassified Arthrobacter]MCC9198012.1 polysaccharide biosynthesis tyrosine autokinase [Arthrobacter sp. zg-Y820]MDK1280879.1 polysaccharide biosynthesis tyrosine autokinase [Arthrobacter sp. zg.Y820]WIB10357.1 polysaccharide biosynthesis tyrosine autokinase [Arthrobacter sp. zg-Y820]
MEIREYLRILRRSWLLVVASVLIAVLIAAVASLIAKPTYTATTQLFVSIQNSGSVSELQQGNTFTQARVQSYVKTAETPAVLQPVIDSLGLESTPSELASQVSATADLNTVLITVSASAPSPVEAAALAQAVGESLVEVVVDLEGSGQGGPSPVKLSVITPATAPSEPSSPNVNLNLAVGALLGLVIGLGIALLRSVLDQRVRNEADLRKVTQKPLLGGITYDPEASTRPLLTHVPAQSPRAESFRQIRTNLQFANVSRKTRTVLVTSSLPGEGKSTTATNLAIALAEAGESVLLVDADLRRPRVDEYLGLERGAGLTTALIGQANVDDLLQPWGDDGLFVLTAGQIPPNPSELLGSRAMKELLLHLESTFDAVIIDASPLLPVTDSAVLAQQVGGVVLVVGSGKVKNAEIQKSIAALDLVDSDILGVVFNLLPTSGPDSYGYSYYSYASMEPEVSSLPGSRRNSRRKIAADPKPRRTNGPSDTQHSLSGSLG